MLRSPVPDALPVILDLICSCDAVSLSQQDSQDPHPHSMAGHHDRQTMWWADARLLLTMVVEVDLASNLATQVLDLTVADVVLRLLE